MEAFFLQGMWLQALFSNFVTLTQVCPRTSFAETALLLGVLIPRDSSG